MIILIFTQKTKKKKCRIRRNLEFNLNQREPGKHKTCPWLNKFPAKATNNFQQMQRVMEQDASDH